MRPNQRLAAIPNTQHVTSVPSPDKRYRQLDFQAGPIPIYRLGCTRIVRCASVVNHCFDRLDVLEVDAVDGLLVMFLVLGLLGGRNEIKNQVLI